MNVKRISPIRIRTLGAVLAVTTLSACVSAPVPVNYAPSSVMTANGALSVGEFKYLPAENYSAPADKQPSAVPPGPRQRSPSANSANGGPVAPNQIRNTALGEIHIDRDVKTFVRDAIFAELRFVGIKMNDPKRLLSGDIQEFLIDDLGYSVDWTLRIRYQLVDAADGKIVYQSVKTVQRNTAKFANAFGALNETIKLNVEELIKDPEFLKAIS